MILKDKLVIAIDFDGTIVKQDYPNIGKLYDSAKECINELYNSGRYYIIIWSTRCGQDEADMINFLNKNEVKYHKVNGNLPEFSELQEAKGFSTPRKIYYDLLVDDKSLLMQSFDLEYEWPMVKNLIELTYASKVIGLKD